MTKILIIEDVHYLRNDVVEMLKFEGYDVRGAENGRVGVDVAREFMPDLIICDIMMPELDGYGVLKEIRGDKQTAGVPFIFLTAKTDRADIREGMGKGAEDYLTKPFLTTELLDTIRARLDRTDLYKVIAEDQLGALRDNITTALPHELRTPLNTIIGFSDMLMLEATQLQPEQIGEWAGHINSAALRLYRLVENYLTYVRIETVARDPERLKVLRQKRVEQPAVVIEFQAMQRAQQQNREIDLTTRVEESPVLAISETDLTKLVDEVVDNAFKFSTPGQRVLLEGETRSECYVVRVNDCGRGMTAAQVTAVGAYMQFERWFYEHQGVGLGLMIVKRLVELHNGSFQIDSTPNVGTTVTIKLPYAN